MDRVNKLLLGGGIVGAAIAVGGLAYSFVDTYRSSVSPEVQSFHSANNILIALETLQKEAPGYTTNEQFEDFLDRRPDIYEVTESVRDHANRLREAANIPEGKPIPYTSDVGPMVAVGGVALTFGCGIGNSIRSRRKSA